MAGKLPTGIDVLDRMLGGGIPAGSVIALTAAPASQSELILYELTAARRTLYLTTQRSAESVGDALQRTPTRVGKPNIQSVAGDMPLDHAIQQVRTLPEESNLIVDPIDPFEAESAGQYRHFLNTVQTHMINTDSIALFHCLDGRQPPPLRDLTEYMADVVFQLETTVSGDTLTNRLTVPKFRGGRALDEPIKLKLSERVSIDTSRDIA